MIRFEYALIVTTASTAAMLAYSSTEPYAAIITVLLPPVFVLAWSGLRGKTRNGGWAAVIGVGIFLGFAALFYTLLLAYCAFTLALMALVLAIARRRIDPLLRLLVIALISGAIALITWGPYLLAALRGEPAEKGTAQHYLPDAGAQLTFPMLSFTLLGALCMLGTLWLVVRARTSTRAGALAIAVLAVLRLVTAVDADHPGRHHAAVLPVAARTDRAAHHRGRVRFHRGDAGHRTALPARNRAARHHRGRRASA